MMVETIEINGNGGEVNVKRILNIFFFYLGFLSRTLTIHRTAGEGEGLFFNSSLPLPPALQTMSISRAITAEILPLHIASSRARTGTFGFRAQVANH